MEHTTVVAHPRVSAARVRERIAQHGFHLDLNEQHATLTLIQNFGEVGEVQALTPLVAERLGITPERLDLLLALDDPKQLRRGLKAIQQQRTTTRSPEELVYPTDGLIGAYLDYAMGAEVPLAWHFWCIVALLGLTCRQNLYMDCHNYFCMPNHYLLLVGPTASCKSTAVKTMKDLATAANPLLEAHREATLDDRTLNLIQTATAQGIIDALQPGTTTLVRSPDHGDRMAIRKDSVGMLVNDELATLLGKDNRYAADVISLLTGLYGEEREYKTRTRTHGERHLVDPCLSFIGASTPEWITDSITASMLQGGFIGRCMLLQRTTSTREYPLADILDPVIRHQLAEWLVPWALTPTIEAMPDAKALEWIAKFHSANRRAISTNPIPLMDPWLARKPQHVYKLAMMLTASALTPLEGPCPSSVTLTAHFLQQALDLVEIEQRHLPDTIASISIHPEAKETFKVLESLEGLARQRGRWVSHTDLYRRVLNHVSGAKELRQRLQDLEESGRLVRHVEGRGTRYWPTSLGPTPEE